MKCNLCGKDDDRVKHYVGGCITHAHSSCAKIAEITIERYIKWKKLVNRIKTEQDNNVYWNRRNLRKTQANK